MLKALATDFDTILNLNEISQDIVYVGYESGLETRLKAVVMGREYENSESEGRIVLDVATIYLKLQTPPRIYDVVKVLEDDESVGAEYKVMSFEEQFGRYKLNVVSNKRSTQHHSTGRFR